MALPKTEPFTAANNASLPAAISGWTAVPSAGAMGVFSNACYSNGNLSENAAYWANDTPSNDQYAQATCVAIGNGANIGVAVRCSTSAYTYYGVYGSSDQTDFFKQVAGVWTQFGASQAALATTDVLRIEANGTTIRYLRDGVQELSTTDSAIASGMLGVSGFENANTSRIDDWEGGNLGGAQDTPELRGRPFGLLGARQIAQLLAQ